MYNKTVLNNRIEIDFISNKLVLKRRGKSNKLLSAIKFIFI